MMQKSIEKLLDSYSNLYVRMAHCGIVAAGSGYFMADYFGNPLFHLSGFLSSLFAETIDFASTLPAIRLMNTNEFNKNGLDKVYKECSYIVREHPTIREYYKRSLIAATIVLTISTIVPTIGYSYLSILPLTLENNKRVKSALRKNLDQI